MKATIMKVTSTSMRAPVIVTIEQEKYSNLLVALRRVFLTGPDTLNSEMLAEDVAVLRELHDALQNIQYLEHTEDNP